VDATDREVLAARCKLVQGPQPTLMILLSTFCSTRLLFIVTAAIQPVSERETTQTLCQSRESVFDEPSRIAVLCAPPE